MIVHELLKLGHNFHIDLLPQSLLDIMGKGIADTLQIMNSEICQMYDKQGYYI